MQLLKAYLPINVTEEGMIKFLRDEQYLKALSPINVTDEGMISCISDEQLEKTSSSIEVIHKFFHSGLNKRRFVTLFY